MDTNVGKRLTMTDATGATSYTYDARDRMLTKTTPFGTVTYYWDSTCSPYSAHLQV